MVTELRKAQEALGNGYLSAFPSSHFDRLEDLKGVWAPYYVSALDFTQLRWLHFAAAVFSLLACMLHAPSPRPPTCTQPQASHMHPAPGLPHAAGPCRGLQGALQLTRVLRADRTFQQVPMQVTPAL